MTLGGKWRRQADSNRHITVLQTAPLATWVWRLPFGGQYLSRLSGACKPLRVSTHGSTFYPANLGELVGRTLTPISTEYDSDIQSLWPSGIHLGANASVVRADRYIWSIREGKLPERVDAVPEMSFNSLT